MDMEKIFVDYKAIPRNGEDDGSFVKVDSRKLFNFDALIRPHSAEELKFLATTKEEWTEVPPNLLDLTTRENFHVIIRKSY